MNHKYAIVRRHWLKTGRQFHKADSHLNNSFLFLWLSSMWMKKPFFIILQYLFFFGLGVLFVWLTVKDINREQWQHIKTSIQQARHWLIVPAFVLLFLAHYSRAIRWKILMEPLGYKPSTFNTFAAVMIGYLVNAGVPRLGEVVKCTLLARYEKVRADRLVGTIVENIFSSTNTKRSRRGRIAFFKINGTSAYY